MEIFLWRGTISSFSSCDLQPRSCILGIDAGRALRPAPNPSGPILLCPQAKAVGHPCGGSGGARYATAKSAVVNASSHCPILTASVYSGNAEES